ncbi:glycine receptor subunit alpha-4-like [Branchiostoma floridae x Branchiostoma japonicum]
MKALENKTLQNHPLISLNAFLCIVYTEGGDVGAKDLFSVDEGNVSWSGYQRFKTGEFLPAGYDASQGPNDNEELHVASSIYITGVGLLSEEHANISISVEYSLSWLDGRLAGLTQSWVPVSSSLIWSPPVAFGRTVRRAIATSEEEDGMWFDPRGLVVLKMSRQLSVNCISHLAMYPLDTQVCTVALLAYNGVKLRLQPSTNTITAPVKSDATGVVSQFTLIGVEGRTAVRSFIGNDTGCTLFEQICDYLSEPCMTSLPDCTKETCGDCSVIVGNCFHQFHFCEQNLNDTNSFDVLEVRIQLRRILWRYLLNNYLPSVVIVASSYLQTWLPVAQSGITARVTLGAMAILSMAKQWELTGRMPWVEEPRAIDIWMLGCLAFVTAFLLETSALHFIYTRIQEKEQREIRSEQRTRELNPPIQIPRPGLIDSSSSPKEIKPQPRNAPASAEPVYIPRARMHTPGYLRWHQVKDKEWVVVIKSEKKSQNNDSTLEASPKTDGHDMVNKDTGTHSEQGAIVSYTPNPSMINSTYDHVAFDVRAFGPSAEDTAGRLATKIDSFARVIFPVAFVILSTAYWVTYRYDVVDGDEGH